MRIKKIKMKAAPVRPADKKTLVSFIVNFCAVFALVCIVALLLLVQKAGNNTAGMAAVSVPAATCENQKQDDRDICSLPGSPAAPAVLFPVAADNGAGQ